MERYFPVVSKTSNTSLQKLKDKNYDSIRPPVQNKPQLEENSGAAMTTFLLRTLSDETNPITHSDIGARSDYVFSTSTGHQVSDGRTGQRTHLRGRERKLVIQQAESCDEAQVLKNVRVYINGFLEDTTDIEMKAIVVRAGGQIVPTPSRCTHILTSRPLCGSKTHKFLNKKARQKYHVVKPEWVFDSIKMGKRRPERQYAIIMSTDANTMSNMLSRT